MDPKREQACREWLARRTAHVDQLEKRYDALYHLTDAETNLKRLTDIEAQRFWIDIHRWELDQMIETGVDDYPQSTEND